MHLITLRDAFVGYVASFEGARLYRVRKEDNFHWQRAFRRSFAGERCASALEYRRVEVGDVDGLVKVLHAMEKAITAERRDHPEKAGADWAEFAARAKN